MNGRNAGFAWRHPAFVPAGALVAALLLALVVGGFGGAPNAPVPPPLAPTTTATTSSPPTTASAAPTEPAFAPAENGIPQFEVTDDQAQLKNYEWVVMAPDLKAADKFTPIRPPAKAQPNTPTPLGEPLVNRLLCVTVPQGWTITVPPSVPNLTPQPDQQATACQGGWSDQRAVPSHLTFVASKAS